MQYSYCNFDLFDALFLENTFGGGARDKVKHFLGDVSYARDFSRSASVAMTLLFKEKNNPTL